MMNQEGLGLDSLETEGGQQSSVSGCGGYYTTDTISEDKYIDQYFEKDLSNNTKDHIFLGSTKLATINNTSSPYYILSDHLGSSSILTDSTGTVAQLSDYQPFGKISYDNVVQNLDNSYKYTGKELDSESNLQYFGARYLGNDVARFYSIDPKVLIAIESALGDPQSLNSYAYALNNPIILIDPNGEDAKDVFWGSLKGIFLGAKETADGISETVKNPTVIIIGTVDFFKNSYDSAVEISEMYKADPNGTIQLYKEAFADASQRFDDLSDEQKGQILGYAIEKTGEVYLTSKLAKNSSNKESIITTRKLVDTVGEIRAGKGNFGISAATKDEALQLGNAWAGDKKVVSGNSVLYTSNDGLKAFRLQYKPKLGKWQANFQENTIGADGRSVQIRNAHMDIIDN